MSSAIVAPTEIDPFTHRRKQTLFLHEKQMEVYRAKSRFKVVVAGRRWGKTQLAKTSIMKFARIPKRLVWYVAPSYRMAKQIMWVELIAALPPSWVLKRNETMLTITLVNGTRIELKGADNPDSLRGVGIHYLVLDEVQDIAKDAWVKVLLPTITSTGGHVLFIGTPKSYNFLYELFMLGQNEANRKLGRWMSWQFPTLTSPFIPADEIEAARADMDEKSFNQEFNASFETMSGQVYYAFKRADHVGKYPFNPLLPIWVGQDFNIDPMSSCILQPQPNGEVWVVSEMSLLSSNTQEVVDQLERRYWRFMRNVTIFPDPAGSYRQHARGESDLDIFKAKGFTRIKHRKKHPPVADRVNAVNRMLRAANGTIRLRIDESCKETISSLEQTLYVEGGREIDKKPGFEHMTDALGYPIELNFPAIKRELLGVSL